MQQVHTRSSCFVEGHFSKQKLKYMQVKQIE